MMTEKGVHYGIRRRAILVLSIVGVFVGAGMWTVLVTASVTNVHVPGSVNIVVYASVTSARFIGGDNLQLRIHLDIMSKYPTGVVKTLSASVAAYSSRDISTAVLFTAFSIHNVAVSGGKTVGVDKLVIVNHAATAAADTSAYLVAKAVQLGDGTAQTFTSSAIMDTSCFISQLSTSTDLGCRVTQVH